MFQFHLTFLRGCTMYVFLQQWPHCLVLESPFVFVYHWLGGTSQYIIAFRSTLSWDETTAATKHFCRPCAAAQLAPNKQSKAKARLLQVTQGLVCCSVCRIWVFLRMTYNLFFVCVMRKRWKDCLFMWNIYILCVFLFLDLVLLHIHFPLLDIARLGTQPAIATRQHQTMNQFPLEEQ